MYGDRPSILRQWKHHWPQQDAMSKILHKGWSRDITARPTMVQYIEQLQGLISVSEAKVQILKQQLERLGVDDEEPALTRTSSSGTDQSSIIDQASF